MHIHLDKPSKLWVLGSNPNRITDATSRMRPTAKSGVFCAGRAVRKLASGMFLRCKKPGKARHILRPPAYVRSPAAQGQGKSRPVRLNPNQITIQHPQPRHPKTVCYTQLHISQCLIETYTNYAIYRLKTFTACLLSRYSHTLLYDSILHGIIG